MAQPDPRNNNNSNRQRSGVGGGANPDPNFNWRGLILFSIAVALIAGAYLANAKNAGLKDVSYPNFRKALDENLIVKDDDKHPGDLIRDPQNAKEYRQGWMRQPDGSIQRFRTEVNLDFNRYLNETLLEKGIVANPKAGSSMLASGLNSIIPIALIVILAILFFRQQIRMARKGALPPPHPAPGKNIQVI